MADYAPPVLIGASGNDLESSPEKLYSQIAALEAEVRTLKQSRDDGLRRAGAADSTIDGYAGSSALFERSGSHTGGFHLEEDDQGPRISRVKSEFFDKYPHLKMPVTLKDVAPKGQTEIDHLKGRYMDYSRVVLSMGGFFFSTGMQWSISKSSNSSYEERRNQCHHNVKCNMASNETLNGNFGWMGLNSDMVWSNGIYLVVGLLIMLFANTHKVKEAASELSDLGNDLAEAMPSIDSAPRPSFFGRLLNPKARVEPDASGLEPRCSTPNSGRGCSTPSSRSSESSTRFVGEKKKKSFWSRFRRGARSSLRRTFIGQRATDYTTGELELRGLFGQVLPGMYWLTGTAIFVEGLLSGLYHTCPSADFQQFDYIGITTCEIAIFLMMWSKCHPRLPSPGSFGVYIAFFGVLSAIETSSRVYNKPYVWAFLWVIIFFFVPVGAASLHFSLPRLITAQEMAIVVARVSRKGQKFEKSTVFSLCLVAGCTMAQIGYMGKGEEWSHKVIIAGAWLVTVMTIVFGLLLVKLKAPRDAASLMEMEDEDSMDIKMRLSGNSDTLKSEAKVVTRQQIQRKQHTWRPIRIAVILLWWFMGFNTCLKGILNPADYNLAHGIMAWHGQGAFLYYMYWFCGMVYFGLIDFKDRKCWGKLARLAFYFLIMMGCAFWGAEYFVNDSYKANADVVSIDISCASDDKKTGDHRMCNRDFVLSTQKMCGDVLCASFMEKDRKYPCGVRDGGFICLIGSLDYNKACVVSILDGHSVWHFLSAISLFVLPLSVMVVDELMMDKPRDRLACL